MRFYLYAPYISGTSPSHDKQQQQLVITQTKSYAREQHANQRLRRRRRDGVGQSHLLRRARFPDPPFLRGQRRRCVWHRRIQPLLREPGARSCVFFAFWSSPRLPSVLGIRVPGEFTLTDAHEDRVWRCVQEIEEMRRRLRQMEEQEILLPAATAVSFQGNLSSPPSPFPCVIALCFVPRMKSPGCMSDRPPC
jgi:hypothetical protein